MAASDRDVILCQWFLLCENPARARLDHPILGPVPICPRCLNIYEGNSK